jgi:light-regulated signal transduction histidine kinase (bacteriophytochrome)
MLLRPMLQDTPDRMDSVQTTIRDIEAEEQQLLAERTADAASARRWVWGSFTLAFALDFVLLVAAFEQLVRAGRDREKIAASSQEIATLNQRLILSNEELENRVAERTRELEASNQELEAFSYSVSHDLRAPLRTIDGFSLALEEDFAENLDAQGRDYISRVRNGVQRMGTLIDSLLQLSRVARSDVQRERMDLSQLATMVFREIQAADPEREVNWIAQPGVMAEADPRLMRIAFENLIGNAWKFTARTPDATVTFGTSPQNGKTVYFLRDNGAGFDMNYVDRLFTAFQRLHGEREFKGSGIGLATVSRIIRRHHGSIWAEGEPGKGATFFFTLTA